MTRRPPTPVRVLGIDPGGFVTGWGLVRREGPKVHLEDSGVIRPPRSADFPTRLRFLHQGLSEILERTRPDTFAIEAVFHAHHARSALQLGHARGVLVLAAAQAGLEVCEYAPASVKKAVTGNGTADKEQVRKMVGMLLEVEIDGAMDRSDALAVAICHAHAGNFKSRIRAAEQGGSPAERSGPLRKVKG